MTLIITGNPVRLICRQYLPYVSINISCGLLLVCSSSYLFIAHIIASSPSNCNSYFGIQCCLNKALWSLPCLATSRPQIIGSGSIKCNILSIANLINPFNNCRHRPETLYNLSHGHGLFAICSSILLNNLCPCPHCPRVYLSFQ